MVLIIIIALALIGFCIFMVFRRLSEGKQFTNLPIDDISILPSYVEKELTSILSSDESIKVTIVGLGNSAMVGTERRVFIFKKGIAAGAAFGIKSSSWDFLNLNGIQIETGPTTGVIALEGPGIVSQDLSSLNFNANDPKNAWVVPHTLVIGKGHLERARLGVNTLRELIANFQQGSQRQPKKNRSYASNVDIERVPCPKCGEMIAKTAKMCRFCRTEF